MIFRSVWKLKSMLLLRACIFRCAAFHAPGLLLCAALFADCGAHSFGSLTCLQKDAQRSGGCFDSSRALHNFLCSAPFCAVVS